MEKRFCKKCGAEIPEGSRFCTKCGTPVEEDDDTEEFETVEEPQSDHRNTVIFVMAVVIIGLVACFGTFLFLTSRNHKENNAVAEASVSETAKPEKTEEAEKKDGALPETTAKTVVKQTPKPTPTPTPEEEEEDDDYEEDYDDEYLLPDSSTRKLTASDLAGMSAQELTYARNEIYARHGKVFQHNELNRYFQTKDWYHADPSFQDTMTSALEQSNAVFILQYQKNNGLTYDPGN